MNNVNYNTIHSDFKLDGVQYTSETLKTQALQFTKNKDDYKFYIGEFLLNWLDSSTTINVKTSGSTGTPKVINIKKQAMVNSAIATGNFFNLKPSSTVLHCLPTNFIAGKMMLVRAMVLGLALDIVKPTSTPLITIENQYDFCAMVPLQLQNSLDKIQNIKTLIVGGASVSIALKTKIQNLKTQVFATYGMTETVTHIAVKPLNGMSSQENMTKQFRVLQNITISKDDRDCLVINASHLNEDTIVTNDIVELKSNTEFEILGRYDNVINSGGIKLIPEQIEVKLQSIIQSRFFIASEDDDTLGQRLILVIEGGETLKTSSFEFLDKYEIPKTIYYLHKFVETPTSKINRLATLKLLK